MTTAMNTTTEQTYDRDLMAARELLDARIPEAGFPEGERDKAIADALNNTWSEGMTVEEWACAAAQMLAQ